MTATVGAESQEALAAPPVSPTAAQPRLEQAERRRQLLQALTTEHICWRRHLSRSAPEETAN